MARYYYLTPQIVNREVLILAARGLPHFDDDGLFHLTIEIPLEAETLALSLDDLTRTVLYPALDAAWECRRDYSDKPLTLPVNADGAIDHYGDMTCRTVLGYHVHTDQEFLQIDLRRGYA